MLKRASRDDYAFGNNAWDTHYNHFPRLKAGLCPIFDQALPAFLNGQIAMMEFWTDLGVYAEGPDSKIAGMRRPIFGVSGSRK